MASCLLTLVSGNTKTVVPTQKTKGSFKIPKKETENRGQLPQFTHRCDCAIRQNFHMEDCTVSISMVFSKLDIDTYSKHLL